MARYDDDPYLAAQVESDAATKRYDSPDGVLELRRDFAAAARRGAETIARTGVDQVPSGDDRQRYITVMSAAGPGGFFEGTPAAQLVEAWEALNAAGDLGMQHDMLEAGTRLRAAVVMRFGIDIHNPAVTAELGWSVDRREPVLMDRARTPLSSFDPSSEPPAMAAGASEVAAMGFASSARLATTASNETGLRRPRHSGEDPSPTLGR